MVFLWFSIDSRTVPANLARPDPFDFQLGVGLRQDGHASTRPVDAGVAGDTVDGWSSKTMGFGFTKTMLGTLW